MTTETKFDTITITGNDTGLDSIDTIDLSSIGSSTTMWSPTYTISTPTSGAILQSGGTASNVVWQTNGINTNDIWSTTADQRGKLTLKGDGADVDINGKSLKSWMEKVEERLNILSPNTNLEAEWDELRELGEQYRALEKRITEKMATWNKLNAMEPPVVK